MRILNTKDYNKHSGKFSLPGFRTGSLFKKIIETGIFKTFVFLNKKHEICKITDEKDLIL